jgi:predicted TIM-barrel fold metal-dependent hydrolase
LIIDTHVHLGAQDRGGDRLVEEAAKLGIDRLVVFNDSISERPTYDEVLAAAQKHPDRIIPFAYLELGTHTASDVIRLHDEGFRGFKCIYPKVAYNDKSLWPVYEAAEQTGMIMLFHLGVVAVGEYDRLRDVDSARMRPIFLDAVCRRFRNLVVWGAHLGNPWYEEAAMLCRWHLNLYFDITGSSLKAKPPEFFRQLLWWAGNKQYGDRRGRGPWEKILFGTDVSLDKMADVMGDYRRLFEGLNLPESDRRAIMGGTAAKLLGLDKG